MGEIRGLRRTGFSPRSKRRFHFGQPDVTPAVTPAPPEVTGPLRAVRRNRAGPCLGDQQPAVESRADQRHPTPPPARPPVRTPWKQVGSGGRRGDPTGPGTSRSVLTWSGHRRDQRRKERHADGGLTFAGAFAAGPGAWVKLAQKWLNLTRCALKLQLISRKGTKKKKTHTTKKNQN